MALMSSASSVQPVFKAPLPPRPKDRPSTIQLYLKQYFIYSCDYDEQEAVGKAAKFVGNGEALYKLSEKRCEDLWQESGLCLYDELRTSPHYPVRKVICCFVRFN